MNLLPAMQGGPIKVSFGRQFVDNKAKGRISKRVFQENKARQISQKTNISYPLIHTGVNLLRD